MHTKQTFGWDIYTIWCRLPICQELCISFFDAIHKFSYNYLVILSSMLWICMWVEFVTWRAPLFPRQKLCLREKES